MTIIVFTMNGTINDYFVAIFFFATSFGGLVYLQRCGFNKPIKPKLEETDQVVQLRQQIEKDLISKAQDSAFWRLFFVSCVFFGISIYAIRNSIDIFGEGQEVTTMGTSAAVMILTNLIAWPSILEGMTSEISLREEASHMARAVLFLNQLEAIVGFCSQLMAEVKDLSDSQNQDKEVEALKSDKEKSDPLKQHFKYLLQSCKIVNQQVLVNLVGGTCIMQDRKREIILKCKLKAKEEEKDGCPKHELRFEADTGEEGASTSLKELVVMDSIAYVQMKGKAPNEYVFIKGSVFNEPTNNKDYDHAYSLVAPCSQAPMVLLLTQKKDDYLSLANSQKNADNDDNEEDGEKAGDEKETTEEKDRYYKQKQEVEKIQFNTKRMQELCNPTYDDPHPKWVQRFLETNRQYVNQGVNAFSSLYEEDAKYLKLTLLDYTQS